MVTLSEENYLKAVYHLSKQGVEAVSTNAIAEKVGAKASSVTDMIKKIAEKDLFNYVKYQGVTLTESGQKMAVLIVRKHRLWELFLVEKLNFSWDEVHEVAEQLEHIKSLKLVNELDAFLGFPKQDPHGDPIPDKNGNIKNIEKELLSAVKTGNTCFCVGVKDSSKAFLSYLNKKEIALGSKFKILSKETYDGSMVLLYNKAELNISKSVSQNIFVKVN